MQGTEKEWKACKGLLLKALKSVVFRGLYAGPYLGILRPWAQENSATSPPPSPYSYSVMCKQKQHKKLTKDKT
jgi:hypothetical protein